MAFRRSTVRSRSAPPSLFTLLFLSRQRCSTAGRIEPSTSGVRGGASRPPAERGATGPARGRAGRFDPVQLHHLFSPFFSSRDSAARPPDGSNRRPRGFGGAPAAPPLEGNSQGKGRFLF